MLEYPRHYRCCCFDACRFGLHTFDVYWKNQAEPRDLANVGYCAIDCGCRCPIKRCRMGSFTRVYGGVFASDDFHGIFFCQEGILEALNLRLCLRGALGSCAFYVVVN